MCFLGVRLRLFFGGGGGSRLVQLSRISAVLHSEYAAHRIYMFRHVSAPAASNTGTAAVATTLANPSEVSSDSFFQPFLTTRNSTAKIFSAFKFSNLVC